jgi:hypothetical protein
MGWHTLWITTNDIAIPDRIEILRMQLSVALIFRIEFSETLRGRDLHSEW